MLKPETNLSCWQMLRSQAFETHANVFPCVTVFDAKKNQERMIWAHSLLKRHRLSTFLRLCRWDLQKINRNKWDKIKINRGCFDWNTWFPDWDVTENKRLEIGSAGSFSCVFLFSFFLFSLSFFLALFKIVN